MLNLRGALRHLEPFLESPAVKTASLLRLEALGRLTDQREWAGAAAPGLDAGGELLRHPPRHDERRARDVRRLVAQ